MFDSRLGGESNLYIVDAHGGVPRKLSIDIHGNNVPRWSHDGSWIYFVSSAKTPANLQYGRCRQMEGTRFASRKKESIPSNPPALWVYFVRQNRLWRVKPNGTMEEDVKGTSPLYEISGFPSFRGSTSFSKNQRFASLIFCIRWR